MIDDPYKVLGVSPDTSDEDIKRAYRRLAKQYHPDRNPGDEVAAKKMQQINAAYEQIKNPEKAQPQSGYGQQGYGSYGGYSNYGGYDPFGGYQQSYQRQQTGDQYQQSAYQYIRYGRYQEALNALQNSAERNARWYYLSALAHNGLGNQVTALEHMRRAVSMDPDNMEYLQALSMLENGGATYRRTANNYGGYRSSVNCSPCTCFFLPFLCSNPGCFWPLSCLWCLR